MSAMRLNAVVVDGVTRVRALIDHPMESGKRNDSIGNTIAANYIKFITVKRGQEVLLSSTLAAGISKNPYLAFEFFGGRPGDELQVEWTDNHQVTAVRSVTVTSED